jgi:hypothetical protein
MSPTSGRQIPPPILISRDSRSITSGFRANITTRAPSRANNRATSPPKPSPTPEMKATRSASKLINYRGQFDALLNSWSTMTIFVFNDVGKGTDA